MSPEPPPPDAMPTSGFPAHQAPSTTHTRTQFHFLRLLLISFVLLGSLSAMGWIQGLTQNWADLTPDASDPALRAPTIDLPPDQAVAQVARVATNLPRWALIHQDPEAGTLHLTYTTPICRFVDDIHLRFETRDNGQRCLMIGQSRSRIGKGDLGQNARNLKMLTRALAAAANTPAPPSRP